MRIIKQTEIFFYLQEKEYIPQNKIIESETGISQSTLYKIRRNFPNYIKFSLEKVYDIPSEIFTSYPQKAVDIDKCIEINKKCQKFKELDKNESAWRYITKFKYLYSIDYNKDFLTMKENSIKEYNIDYKIDKLVTFSMDNIITHYARLFISDRTIDFQTINEYKGYVLYSRIHRGEIENNQVIAYVTGYIGEREKCSYSLFSKEKIDKIDAFNILKPFDENQKEIPMNDMRRIMESRILKF